MSNDSMPVLDAEKLVAEQHLLEFLQEPDLNDIATIAAQICCASEYWVMLTDIYGRVVRCASHMPLNQSTEYSFCDIAVQSGEDVFFVADLSTDPRFIGDSFTIGGKPVAFCAAVVLNSEDNTIGTLCILDSTARNIDRRQVNALGALGRQLLAQLELNKKSAQFNHSQAELERAYTDLEKVSFIASHDLRGPLNNIISLTHLLIQEYGSSLDEEGNQYISFLNDAAYQFLDMISGILNYSKSSQLLVDFREKINFTYLIEEVLSLLDVPANATINFDTDNRRIYTSHTALKQILLNLIHNAIKHNDKAQIKIDISLTETPISYLIEVKDNGPGIHEQNRKKVFELFEKLGHTDEGTGIGLPIVKRLVEKLDGTIRIDAEMNVGSSFVFFIPKV